MLSAPHELQRRIEAFLEANNRADLDTILQLTYPRVFEEVPAEHLRQAMADSQDNEEIKTSLDDFRIDSLEEPIHFDGNTYVPIHYAVLTSLQLTTEKDNPEEQADYQNFMLHMAKSQYGEDNCWYEATTNSYCIYHQMRMLAIRDSYSPDWTFLRLEHRDAVEKWIPAFVVMQLFPDHE